MSREVAFTAYPSEVEALADGGLTLRMLIDGRWAGPEWVGVILNHGPVVWDKRELKALAEAVRGGLDPDALATAYRLGGKRGALTLVEDV